MKTNILFSLLLTTVIILTACGGKDKSSDCDVITFKDGDRSWSVSGNAITGNYPKGATVSNISPTIVVSPKATVSPKSGDVQDFSNDKTVTYTVTAEDGKTTKTYTARAIIATQ